MKTSTAHEPKRRGPIHGCWPFLICSSFLWSEHVYYLGDTESMLSEEKKGTSMCQSQRIDQIGITLTPYLALGTLRQ